jgi:N-acetylglucosamine-6-phosphate deacetylase
MLIVNGRVLHYDRLETGSVVRIAAGKILDIAPGLTPAPGEHVIDAIGGYVLPGLIDLHTHGLRRALVQDDDWMSFAALQLEQGVTGCLPTLFAGPARSIESMKTGLTVTDHFKRTPNLLGFRLEFPYLAKTGAGQASALAPIQPQTTQTLYEAGEGFIKVWDVSPELDGAIPFVRWATGRGIVTSLAHSSATIEQTRRAVDNGLRLVTHFYDTFDLAVQTDPGVYPAGLTDYIQVEDRLTVEIIPDGVHVHPLLVEKTLRCKGIERVAFVTDSVRGAGSRPGIYSGLYEGTQIELTADRGARRLPDGGLSGSALTHLKSFQNCIDRFGKSMVQASILCSRTPARLLGLAGKGYLAGGMDADIVLLDNTLALQMTIVGGEVAYQV